MSFSLNFWASLDLGYSSRNISRAIPLTVYIRSTVQEPVYVLHLIPCHGCIMHGLAELLFYEVHCTFYFCFRSFYEPRSVTFCESLYLAYHICETPQTLLMLPPCTKLVIKHSHLRPNKNICVFRVTF